MLLFREAGLLTGGTVGVAFLIHYLSGWPIGLLLFAINLPFYLLALRAMGRDFTVKTFLAVSLLALYTELLPGLVELHKLDRLFAAIMGGFLAGISLLMLIRHKASLGGVNILALFLQERFGLRAGAVQMGIDAIIVLGAIFVVTPDKVALSVLGAVMLNLVLALNHRSDRYVGVS